MAEAAGLFSLKLRGRSVGTVPLSPRAPPLTEAMGHLAWGGPAIPSITNRNNLSEQTQAETPARCRCPLTRT
jgi:hypothetical protein